MFPDKSWETHIIDIDRKKGDQVTIEAYQGLPEFLNLAPGLSILCGIAGLVLVLRARAAKS